MKSLFYITLLAVIVSSACKKSKDEGNIDPQKNEPQKAVLVSPVKDEACLDGTSVSDNQSKVNFSWRSAQNSDSYELVVKNLLNNQVVREQVSGLNKELTLAKNTPYSWYIVSKANGSDKVAESEVWRFYNAGLGISQYAPFPAQIISPAIGQVLPSNQNKITLQWSGKDVDNDITGYDVYIGTTPQLELTKSNVTNSSFEVSVQPNTVYRWKVITKDSKGNTSDSGIYQFTVE
ncbi:hypothetical protein EIM50_16005 [Pseudoxanthomonas sp. SGD-10]|nr:hypothetical protein EIM50_16005 [Pseudoxanthomonas sp. SGD-10]